MWLYNIVMDKDEDCWTGETHRVDRNPLHYLLLHSKSFFIYFFSPEASRGLYRTNPQPRNHENQSRVMRKNLMSQ